jgi:hypothetical protein
MFSKQLSFDFSTPKAHTWKQPVHRHRCEHPHCRYMRESRSRWYKGYLASDRWNQIRKVVIELARDTCEVCRLERATQVHHKNYNQVGYEEIEDLIAICARCHNKIHHANSCA